MSAGRLKLLFAHDALLILKNTMSLPSLLHILRSAPCHGHPSLQLFDDKLRESLAAVLNVALDDAQWCQASLPVRDGGLGIRSAVQLAPSAFLASAAASAPLVARIHTGTGLTISDPGQASSLTAWSALGGSDANLVLAPGSQRAWDAQIVNHVRDSLVASLPDEPSQARLRAVMSPHSGDWLHAFPITAVGLRLSDEEIRIAAGLRLGSVLCAPHTCRCGALVTALGQHGLSCRMCKGRHLRHNLINDLIFRALIRAGIPSIREPTGLIVGSPLKPDGVTMIPWASGRRLAWDATTPDTLAVSHLATTSLQAGGAAASAARLKNVKYEEFARTYTFVPVAVETLGAWDAVGLGMMMDLGRRLTARTGDQRETFFLLQRLSVAIQKGNAASVLGTLPKEDEEEI